MKKAGRPLGGLLALAETRSVCARQGGVLLHGDEHGEKRMEGMRIIMAKQKDKGATA